MGYNNQLDKPILKFPKYFNRKKLLITIGAILLVAVISVVVWVVWWNFSPVATVNGEKISRQEFNTETSQLEKFYKYNKDKKSLKNLDQITKDRLTEEAIIRAESQRRGIKVSAAEINVEYQKLVKQYKSEAEFTQTIKSAYDYTPQLAKNAIEIRLLRDKLQLEVLKGYDVTEYLVRYDLGTRGLKENPTSKGAIDAAYIRLQQGSTMEKLATDPICQPSICGIASMSHVNAVTAINLFFASKGEDYAAISKLTKTGEITGIVKSSGGYYVIYRADRISRGTFNTWDEFIKDYKSKYVSYGTATKIAVEYKRLSYWLLGLFNTTAYAVTSDGSNCSYNSPQGPDDKYSPIGVSGHVYDAVTDYPIASATIRAYISNYKGSCYKQFATQSAKNNSNYNNIVNFCPSCGRSDNTVTTNSNGKYLFNDSNTVECHFHYTWTYQAAGYDTKTFDGVPPNNLGTGHLMNGQSMVSDVRLAPTPHDLTIIIVNSGGSSGTVNSSDGTNPINCTDNNGVCTRQFTHYGVETTLTASAGSGSSFSSWSGNTISNPAPPVCNTTSATGCTVRMGQDRTITATFYKAPVVPHWSIIPEVSVYIGTPPAVPVHNITASPTQVVRWKHSIYNNSPDTTSTVNYYWHNSGGYWSGDGGASWFSGLGPYGTNNVPTSPSHPVTQDDVGKTLCRWTMASPKAWNDTGLIAAGPACASIPYNYTLTPSVGHDHSDVIDVGESFKVIPGVSSSGPTKSKATQWQLTQMIVNPGVTPPHLGSTGASPTAPAPCVSYFAGSGVACTSLSSGTTVFDENGAWSGSTPGTISVTVGDDYAIGTRLCYAFSLQPWASLDDRWIHTAPKCLVVGKSPKTQIWGGDLLVREGGGLVTTSKSLKSERTFGSWAEYGIIAAGNITGAASGAAFAGPGLANATICGYSPLSFTNAVDTKCIESVPIGNYSSAGSMPDVDGSFPGLSKDINPGNYDVNSLTAGINSVSGNGNVTLLPSELSSGKTIILKTTGEVTISGDITYANGPYPKISQLPQLVIIADRIIINSGVSQVNAWLIAKNSDNTGFIKTCEIVGDMVNKCSNPLTINGPVMTNHLYLYRTAGSGSGVASGDPAEVFNLRADAYLWAVNQATSTGRIRTVYTTELPPRF